MYSLAGRGTGKKQNCSVLNMGGTKKHKRKIEGSAMDNRKNILPAL